MKGFRYLKDVTTVELDHALCIGCGKCFEVCPHQVFELEENRARIVDKDACLECGACALNCPVSAIEVDSGVGCATGIIQEWFKGKNISGFGSGCCG
jgi:NAD-dependent dihydropyrimidine dehydrogenase PreA subunit